MTSFGIVPNRPIIAAFAICLIAWSWPPGHNMENEPPIGFDSATMDGQEALGRLWKDGTMALFLYDGTGWRPMVVVPKGYMLICPDVWKDYSMLDKTRKHALPPQGWARPQWNKEFNEKPQCVKTRGVML